MSPSSRTVRVTSSHTPHLLGNPSSIHPSIPSFHHHFVVRRILTGKAVCAFQIRMLEVEPTKIVFRDLRLNQPYTTSLCLTNPLDVSVDFALRPNHSRYTVSPNSVHLRPGQSIVVSIRVYISSYPKAAKGSKGTADYLLLVSSFFQQKVEISLLPRTLEDSKEDHDSQREPNTHPILEKQSSSERFASLTNSFERENPEFEKILEERIQEERSLFEEKSQKV